MLSENQRIRGLISSVIDIVLLIAAYLLANFLRFNWLPFFEEGGAGPALDIARSPMVALGGLRRGDGAALLEPRAV